MPPHRFFKTPPSPPRTPLATGRKPNIRNLGLESVDVKVSDKGAIEVNELSQTSVSWVIAYCAHDEKGFCGSGSNTLSVTTRTMLQSPTGTPPPPTLPVQVPSVWAIGDVTDRLNLTPVALMEAMALVRTLFAGENTAPDHSNVATAVFSHPEIGTVGLTEANVRRDWARGWGVLECSLPVASRAYHCDRACDQRSPGGTAL